LPFRMTCAVPVNPVGVTGTGVDVSGRVGPGVGSWVGVAPGVAVGRGVVLADAVGDPLGEGVPPSSPPHAAMRTRGTRRPISNFGKANPLSVTTNGSAVRTRGEVTGHEGRTAEFRESGRSRGPR
jgi:hypothetical protein